MNFEYKRLVLRGLVLIAKILSTRKSVIEYEKEVNKFIEDNTVSYENG